MSTHIQSTPSYRRYDVIIDEQPEQVSGTQAPPVRSDSTLTMSQIMGELMLLLRKLFDIMKEGQATAELKTLELQIVAWEKNFAANKKNLDASNKRAWADGWSAIATAALAGIGAAVGLKSSVFNGLQITGQFSPITDKATSAWFNGKAGEDSKQAEDLRANSDVCKAHSESMQRTASLHQEEADKQQHDFKDVYGQMVRTFLDLERMIVKVD